MGGRRRQALNHCSAQTRALLAAGGGRGHTLCGLRARTVIWYAQCLPGVLIPKLGVLPCPATWRRSVHGASAQQKFQKRRGKGMEQAFRAKS